MTQFGWTCAALMADEEEGAEEGAHAESPRQPRLSWPAHTAPVKPRDDGRAPHTALLDRLGLTGIFDAHSHWFPETVMRKIWEYFDQHYWPITYRQLPEGRLEWLRRNKVSRFTTLNYAHRPAMAAWLNEWSAQFAAKTPEAVPCGTFFKEPAAAADVKRCIEEYGFRGFKLHLRVSDMDPNDPLLLPAFEQIEAAGLPVVIHSGSAPDPGRFTAPAYMKALVERFPRLRIIVAHMGAWEFAEYMSLAEQYDHVYLDTTMVFVGFEAVDPFPLPLLARLERLSGKVLFGSDFPNIPYPLSHAVTGIGALPLSEGAMRRILWENAAALFGIEAGVTAPGHAD